MRLLLLLGLAAALLATPALAAFDLSRISGPWQIPIYGSPTTDAMGDTYTPIAGYQTGVAFVVPADKVTPDLQPYANPVPTGVPVLEGVASVALIFPDLATAQAALAIYWSPNAGSPP